MRGSDSSSTLWLLYWRSSLVTDQQLGLRRRSRFHHVDLLGLGLVVRAHGELFLSRGFRRGTLTRPCFSSGTRSDPEKNLNSRLFRPKSVLLFRSGGNRALNKHCVAPRREALNVVGNPEEKKKKKKGG